MSRTDLEQYYLQKSIPYVSPFYSVDYHNDEDILTWLRETDTALSSYYQPLFREQKNNLRIFLNTGMNANIISPVVSVYLQQGLIDSTSDEIYINEMYLLVMEQVSTIVSNELTAQVLPNNEDYRDKIAAKFVKEWLDSMSYDFDIDIQRIRWSIQQKIFGEAYVVPKWDSEAGDIHPMARDMMGEEVPYLDEKGKKVRGSDGEIIKVDENQRVGDIDLVNPLPFDVMIDPKDHYKKSNWFYYSQLVENDELARSYPDIHFKNTKRTVNFDSGSGFDKTTTNHTEVYYFNHRSHKFIPEGRYIICTKEDVLENRTIEDEPTLIDSRQLPLVRFLDMDIGVGIRGNPILFRNARNVVAGYNKLTNQIYNNLEAESPKIMVHETAGVDAQRMPNGVIVMEWRGNIKPTVETPITNTNSIFKFREDIKKNIIELGGQTPMVRGDTPNAQLDSFVALQHFEDQRVQLAAPDIKNHVKAIEHLYRFMIVLSKDHYDSEDQRLIKIVGTNNKFNLKYFEPENLNKVYDVKITTTGNLANSKAARTQLIMTLKREFPGLMSDEVFIDMLGLSSSEKFQNQITVAVQSAESENEDMLNGEQVLPPERFEDLITHWETHRIPLQSREYKMAPLDVQDLFERHLTATEKLMFDQMAESPVFASRIAGLRQFPLMYSPLPNNEGPQGEGQQITDQAAEGEEVLEDEETIPEEVVDVNQGDQEGIPSDLAPEQEGEASVAAPEPT